MFYWVSHHELINLDQVIDVTFYEMSEPSSGNVNRVADIYLRGQRVYQVMDQQVDDLLCYLKRVSPRPEFTEES